MQQREIPPPPEARAIEIKEKVDGSRQTFPLERWLRTRDLLVGRWVADADNAFGAPVGLTSWGVWWRTRPYGAYRIHDVDGALLSYRLDAVGDVRIDGEGVRYRDLVLDARIRTEAGVPRVRLEDEDELEAAAAAGLVSLREQRRVACTRLLFLHRPERLVARIDEAIEQAVQTVASLRGA